MAITLALPARPTFFVGLVLIVVGTGLLKPNISAMVGELYDKRPEGSGCVRTSRSRAPNWPAR